MTCSGDTCSKPVSQPAVGTRRRAGSSATMENRSFDNKKVIGGSCVTRGSCQAPFVLKSMSASVFVLTAKLAK
jgi:hypothetical protein